MRGRYAKKREERLAREAIAILGKIEPTLSDEERVQAKLRNFSLLYGREPNSVKEALDIVRKAIPYTPDPQT